MTNTKGQYKGEPANSPEKPDGSKYEARVREIAEKLAKATPQTGHPTTHLILSVYAERFIPAARIAVKHLAEAFKDGYNAGKYPVDPSETLHGWITELGLIPSPNQLEEPGK